MEKHFAALKIPDSEPDVKLTRAISFSELPSTRRILIEQCYRSGDSVNLIRQYSCEQISHPPNRINSIKFSEVMRAGNDERTRTWKSTVPYRSNLETLNWKTDSNNDTVPPSTPINNQVEYMEVEDLESTNQLTFVAPIAPTSICSGKSLSSRDSKDSNEDLAKPVLVEGKLAKKDDSDCVREDEQNKKPSNSYQNMKDRIRPLVPKRTANKRIKRCRVCSKMCFKILFLILFPIFVVLTSILLYQDQNHKHSTNFVNAIAELRKQIHGQDRAVQAISEYLQSDVPYLKVLALVGGTGVGKSYTAEIIKTNFPRTHSVRQYFSPVEATISDTSLPFLFPELIILENLKERDLTDVVNFLKTREKIANGQYITVLAVFNVEQMSDDSTRSIDLKRSLETIRSSFTNGNIDANIIPYDSLSEDTLEKCIMNAAKHSGLMLSDSQIDLIKQNLLINNAGCKGAYSKVQVIGRQ